VCKILGRPVLTFDIQTLTIPLKVPMLILSPSLL